MALLISACAPVARATLPTTPPRGAVRVDLEEMKECLQLQRRANTPRISSVERPLLAARLAELPPEVLRVARAAEVDGLLSTLLTAKTAHATWRSRPSCTW